VGRDDVLERLQDMLGSSRWVTLTGPPGCGKTLVARHAAATAPRSAWVGVGAWHRTTPVLVGACLDALGAEVAPGDSEQLALKRALDGQDLLLVLDGVDAIDGLGAVLNDLVEEADGFRLLCTATTVAARSHEKVLRMLPLPVPLEGSPLEGPAVELLLGRVASTGGRTLDLDRHEQTVRRLLVASGGLPSVIEQLAVQIALIGVSDVTPAGTMSQAVRGSYELLDEDQQRCFRRLAAVGQPVTLEALADVCEVSRTQAVQLAAALARRSLVEVHPDGRFDMLAPLREVGAELAASRGDDVRATAGVVRWAERVVPQASNTGAADAPWLADVPLLGSAVRHLCATEQTRPRGYALANRAFSSLYTAMRARDALGLLEGVLDSGEGPPDIGSQLARRAGICASEVRGTYEGLRLLDRAMHYAAALEPGPRDLELARNAAIRAEMHLDAGRLGDARDDVEQTLGLSAADPNVIRQVRRTLMDVCVSEGSFEEAERLAALITDSPPLDEMWLALSAQTLQARMAFERGRLVEAESLAHHARDRAVHLHEDRVALLAQTTHRLVTGRGAPGLLDPESLPWALRLVVQVQDARELLASGEVRRAAGRAADIVVLADSIQLGREAVEGRLLVADALMAMGEPAQAQASYLSALRRASTVPMPLRAAEALDALAGLAGEPGTAAYRQLAGAAAALRAPRQAVAHPRPGAHPVAGAVRDCPRGWVRAGQLTPAGLAGATECFAGTPEPERESPLANLTKAEHAVAGLVAEGLTSRQIAERLFVSPRTVDAHLAHIYRKLEIPSRAKLAALMAEVA
jgi:DNA-binding CsgD family transcriptional regulator/tetratricopeptide (TPR) repeat protein